MDAGYALHMYSTTQCGTKGTWGHLKVGEDI